MNLDKSYPKREGLSVPSQETNKSSIKKGRFQSQTNYSFYWQKITDVALKIFNFFTWGYFNKPSRNPYPVPRSNPSQGIISFPEIQKITEIPVPSPTNMTPPLLSSHNIDLDEVSKKTLICTYPIQDLSIAQHALLINGHIWKMRWNFKEWEKGDIIEIYKAPHYFDQYFLKNLRAKTDNYGSPVGPFKPDIKGNSTEIVKTEQWKGSIEFTTRNKGFFQINVKGQSVLIEVGKIVGKHIPKHWNSGDPISLLKDCHGYKIKNFKDFSTRRLIDCDTHFEKF